LTAVASSSVAQRPHVAVIGGGLAGLAATAALAGEGYRVTVLEAKPFLGGRATSYPLRQGDETLIIDNCQHVLLRCCTCLMDLYTRLGVADSIQFFQELWWIEPGGRTSVMKRGLLQPPLHFAESFLALRFLSIEDKLDIGRAMLAVKREYQQRADLDRITMLDWLNEKKQSKRAVERFWRQVLVSAINEDLDRMAAAHGLQVFWVGFLAKPDSYEMGIPKVPLGELYSERVWSRFPEVEIRLRAQVTGVERELERVARVVAGGKPVEADAFICAVPFERIPDVLPWLSLDVSDFEHSPITGIHLWFDRPVTSLPHATLLDRTIQWMFNKSEGRHIQVVVSASRSLIAMPRQEIIQMAVSELADFFPAVREAKLERAHVVKEVRATFSARPGLETRRPGNETEVANLFLAGDWTRSGWPATMEGAVRSGYLAAEAVTRFLGGEKHFLIPNREPHR
jgi:squalene-associated FAD-dependent desaturase